MSQEVIAGEIRQLVFTDKTSLLIGSILTIKDPSHASDYSNPQVESLRSLGVRLKYSQGEIAGVSSWSYSINASIRIKSNQQIISSFDILIDQSNNSTYFIQQLDILNVPTNSEAEFELVVNSITTTNAPDAIILEFELIKERYHYLAYSSPMQMYYQASTSTVSWQPIEGAEEYDIEWVFIDDQVSSSVKSGFTTPESPFLYKEGIQVRLSASYYTIEEVYPQGTLYFRVRAVGRHLNNVINDINYQYDYIKLSQWQYSGYSSKALSYTISSDFETNKNWQYVASYAEEGKRKSVITYGDGGLRSRQSLSRMSSSGYIVMSNSLYDYEGRMAVSVLPSPIEQSQLTYKTSQIKNYDNTILFDKEIFDNTGLSNKAIGDFGGSGKYYSSSNNTSGVHKDYIADAEGYPYVHTLFERNNTGRVIQNSGLGYTHRIGSGHEISYYYDRPSQNELIRMFGSNVGESENYKRYYTKDANGQLSAFITNGLGQTIATYLLGNNTTNLISLPSSSESLVLDLSKGNIISFDNTNSSMVNYSIFNSIATTNYSFSYDLGNIVVNTLSVDDCLGCTYDLRIQILKPDGSYEDQINYEGNISDEVIYTFSPDDACNPSSYSNVDFTVNFGEQGTYTIIKTLRLNQAALSAIEAAASTHADYPDLTQIKNNYLSQIDTTECDITCEDKCRTMLILSGNLNPSDLEIANCVEDNCGEIIFDTLESYGDNSCDYSLDQMKSQVSPQGYYYEDDTWLDNNLSCLSLGSQNSNITYVRSHWDDLWADLLVQQHPEYCHYTNCAINKYYKAYMYEMSLIKSKSEAISTGYFYPLSTPAQDPFYLQTNVLNPLPSAFTTFTNSMQHYYTGGDPNVMIKDALGNLVVPTNPDWTLQEYVTLNEALYYNIDDTDPDYTILRDQQCFRIFRGLYDDLRLTAIDDMQQSGAGFFISCSYISDKENRIFSPYIAPEEEDVLDDLWESNINLCWINASDWLAALVNECPSISPTDQTIIEMHLFNYCNRTVGFVNPFGIIESSDISTDVDLIIVNDILATYTNCTVSLSLISEISPYYTYSSNPCQSTTINNYHINSYLVDIMNIINDNLHDEDPICSTPYIIDQYSSYYNLQSAFNTSLDLELEWECTSGLQHIIHFYDVGGSNIDCRYKLVDENDQAVDVTIDDYFTYQPSTSLPSALSSSYEGIKLIHHRQGADDTEVYLVYLKTETCFSTTVEECIPNGLSQDIEIIISPEVERDSCIAIKKRIAILRAKEEFKKQKQFYINGLIRNHVKTCLSDLSEEFTVTFERKDYHYTLYYYDQAGSLIQTVPPQGVHLVETVHFPSGVWDQTEPVHTMKTKYKYNSLAQLIWQSTPDAGESNFYYNSLQQLRFSQNAQQAVETIPTYSYTKYDPLARIIEVGQSNNTPSTIISRATADDANFPVQDLTNICNKQITKLYYDEVQNSVFGTPISDQANLRNRISHTAIDYDGDGNYEHASHYSYDIHGNVKTLVQDNKVLASAFSNQQYKRIDYLYDLMSGNVNEVRYQEGQQDAFYHRYDYDADNRLTNVYTSRDKMIWDQDAKYFYYLHGPLARVEIGDNKVQSMDYAYTIHGWLKGINSDAMQSNLDIGLDGDNSTGNLNKYIAEDVMSFSLGYYKDDYKSIGSTQFLSQIPMGSSGVYDNTTHDLFNGNISRMISNIYEQDINGVIKTAPTPHLNVYKYDQLNRIKSMDVYRDGLNNNIWSVSSSNYSTAYGTRYSYDANGNIMQMSRNGNDAITSNPSCTDMDDISYQYITDAQIGPANKLDYVNDQATDYAQFEDIKQANNMLGSGSSQSKYYYDKIGNLTKDERSGISNIDWMVSGKVRKVQKAGNEYLEFYYDAMGNRIGKKHDNGSGLVSIQWYVRDASGNVMGVYKQTGSSQLMLKERAIYGSSRIGVDMTLLDMTTAGNSSGVYSHAIGDKYFELSNHLGNVLTTISDKSINKTDISGNLIGFTADIVSAGDYYPFGMQMPGRQFSSNAYRYGFQGQEKDDEIKGEGNSVNYKYRMHDPRIGRFFAVDPLASSYPYNSVYAFSENVVINCVELEGLESEVAIYTVEKHKNGAYTTKSKETMKWSDYQKVAHEYGDVTMPCSVNGCDNEIGIRGGGLLEIYMTTKGERLKERDSYLDTEVESGIYWNNYYNHGKSYAEDFKSKSILWNRMYDNMSEKRKKAFNKWKNGNSKRIKVDFPTSKPLTDIDLFSFYMQGGNSDTWVSEHKTNRFGKIWYEDLEDEQFYISQGIHSHTVYYRRRKGHADTHYTEAELLKVGVNPRDLQRIKTRRNGPYIEVQHRKK